MLSFPASKLWTKELDFVFAQAFQGIHGDNIRHSKDSNEATEFRWSEVLARLVEKESWPEPLTSVEALKKRWNNMFRVWYAKKYSERQVLRERTIHLPTLIQHITERDYREEGKPGPKKGSTVKRKKGEDASFREELELESSFVEPFSPPASPLLSPIQLLGPEKKARKELMRPAVLSRRLEAWLFMIRNPLVQEHFQIHTHSGIKLEPVVVLNALIVGSLQDPFVLLLSFAQSMAPPEWVPRIVAIKDEQLIREHVTQKRSFFLIPSTVIKLEERVLLFVLASYSTAQQPLCYAFMHEDKETTYADGDANFMASLGLPNTFPMKSMTFNGTFSRDVLLAALHVFSICLSNVPFGGSASFDLSEQLRIPWPDTETLRLTLLTKIFVNTRASLQPAPNKEPLALPHDSLIDALKTSGVSVPSWCLGFAADKRHDLLEALRETTSTVIFMLYMSNASSEVTWHRKPTDKAVLLIAERGGKFGGVIRISEIADDRAILSILANRDAVRSLLINQVAYTTDRIELTLRSGLALEIGVDEVSLRMTVHS